MADPVFGESSIWRAAGGGCSRRGLFDRVVTIQPRPFRRLPAHGAVQAEAVFDRQGKAFVADMAGHVQAFTADGRLTWRVQVTGGVSATPVVHGEKPWIFVGTHAGYVFSLDTFNGMVRWQKQVPTTSDPRILSDLLCHRQSDAVVLNSWGGRFLALDVGNGDERFSWDAGISPYGGAAADKSSAIFSVRAVSGKGVEFVRVSGKGEEVILHTEPEGKRGARRTMVAATPVVDDERGVVFFVANRDTDGRLCAWSLKSGRILWDRTLPAAVQGTPAVLKDGLVVVADLSGAVHAFGHDGAERWRYASGCEYLLAGGAGEAGGTCYLGDPLGIVHQIPATGEGKSIFQAARSVQARPSFDPDGNLYVPSTDRSVYVFRAA